MSETFDSESSPDELASLDIEPETRLRQLLARARTDETPADTTSDSGVEGGVDAPNESTEDDPQGAAGNRRRHLRSVHVMIRCGSRRTGATSAHPEKHGFGKRFHGARARPRVQFQI